MRFKYRYLSETEWTPDAEELTMFVLWKLQSAVPVVTKSSFVCVVGYDNLNANFMNRET
jgi:hypothetical protein